MTYELVNQFVISSNTFKIHKKLNAPIVLNQQEYNYFLRVLTVQFSNVVPNVTEDLYVSGGVKLIDKGIWTLQEMVDKYNNANQYAILELDEHVGRFNLVNNTSVSHIYLDNSFLTSPYIGFENADFPLTLTPGQKYMADRMPVIQEYNYFVLNSGNINGYTYKSVDSADFRPSNCIWPFSSAISAFQFKTWVAIQPVEFKLDTNSFQYIDFEIRDAYDREIKDLLGPTDFMITCQIVKYKKM